jgi:hypothetical protein
METKRNIKNQIVTWSLDDLSFSISSVQSNISRACFIVKPTSLCSFHDKPTTHQYDDSSVIEDLVSFW